MLECIPIIKLLKNDPRYLYVTRVRQPWKGFVKHFILNVLQKISLTESVLQSHVTLTHFNIPVHCFQFQNITLVVFQNGAF